MNIELEDRKKEGERRNEGKSNRGRKPEEEQIAFIDTTVQEKNVTFPTDSKLLNKIIEYCHGIARKEGIRLHQTFGKEIKQLKLVQRFRGRSHSAKKVKKADKRMRTIAGILLREIERKLPEENPYRELLSQSEDASVTILSIGFFTNLARLLESAPDEYSPLTGRELVRRKVKTVVAMCGSTLEPEYNIYNDLESAKVVFSQLPVTMTVIPAEVHLDVPTADIVGATSWVVPHPLHVCFSTLHADDGNWLWDASAALSLVKGFSNATVSGRYVASLDVDGTMRLTPSAVGRFRTVSLTESQTTHNETLLLQYLGTVL